MAFPSDKARKHIERLEKKHEIETRIVRQQWHAEAAIKTRQVWIPDPTTPLKYLIALHEFGHILDKVSAKVHKGHGPEAEAAAWRWAIDNAITDLLDYMTPRGWVEVGKAWLTSVNSSAFFKE